MDLKQERRYWRCRLAKFFTTVPLTMVSEPSPSFRQLYIDPSQHRSGSQFTVYTHCCWGSAPCVVKMLRMDLESTEDDNLSLFSEAIAHAFIQERCRLELRPSRLIPLLFVSWLQLHGQPCVCFGLEKFDYTLYRHQKHMTRHELHHAVRDIGTELCRWNSWNFFHRDVHFGNIGWYSGRWHLFDVGMAIWQDQKGVHAVYAKPGTSVYTPWKLEFPHATFDRQLLHMSSAIYLGADFNPSTRKVVQGLYHLSPPLWQRGLPLLSKTLGKCRFHQLHPPNKVEIILNKKRQTVILSSVRVNELHPHAIYYLYKQPPPMTALPCASVPHEAKCDVTTLSRVV